MSVAVWPGSAPPVARVRLLFHAGATYEPNHSSGIASLVGPLLRAANRRRRLEVFERLLETMGTDVVTEVEWESAAMTLDVLAKDVEPAVDLLFDLASCPVFPQPAIDALRAKRLAQLRHHARDPAVLATDVLFNELFPGHRYGTPLAGTADSVSRISRDDIVRFHARWYTPQAAALVVAGQASRGAVLGRAERFAARSSGGAEVAGREIDRCAISPAHRVVIVDCPQADTTELRIGRRSVDQAHPDALTLQVVGTLLGGSSFSRLNRRLRREGGYCYSVHSRFVLRRMSGAFLVSANIPTEAVGRVARDVLDEVGTLRAAPVGADEVLSAVRHLETALVHSWSCLTGQSDRLAYVLANHLEDDYFDRCVDAIRAVSPERLMELSQQHLSEDQMVVVAAGPAKSLRKQFQGLADVHEIRQTPAGR